MKGFWSLLLSLFVLSFFVSLFFFFFLFFLFDTFAFLFKGILLFALFLRAKGGISVGICILIVVRGGTCIWLAGGTFCVFLVGGRKRPMGREESGREWG